MKMEVKKESFQRLAWVGLVIMILGLPQSVSASSSIYFSHMLGSGMGWLIGVFCGGLGILFMLIGGFLARPKYFGLAIIIVSFLYIGSFFGQILLINIYWDSGKLVLWLLPGILGIIEGLALLKMGPL